MVFVGLQMYDEYQGVVVFNLLHGGFGGQRVLDDVESVHPGERDKQFIFVKTKEEMK